MNLLKNFFQKKYLAAIRFGFEYASHYPNDYKIYATISLSYIMLGDFDTSKEYFEYFKYYDDYKFSSKYYSIMISFYLHNHEYEKFEEFIRRNYYNIAKDEDLLTRVRILAYFLRKKFGIDNNLQLDYENKYLISQLDNYLYDMFLNHLGRHIIDGFDYQETQAYFNKDIDITNLIELVRKNLNHEETYLSTWITRKYYFKYDKCGTQDNQFCNYFVVVAAEDSDNFITMYPAKRLLSLNCVDLNLATLDKNPSIKVKRLSQTDKFNNRYTKK